MTRVQLLQHIAQRISATQCTHPLRVAIDGIDAAGKTTFADELVTPLAKFGRQVIRASIDGFHYPSALRYHRGKDSPEGYFFDSFDYDALKTSLLEPLGPEGDLAYQTNVFDFQADVRTHFPTFYAHRDAILIMDGIFLLRPELAGYWDFSIFLDVDFDVAVARAAQRDQVLFGSAESVRARYWVRYVPGQKIYLETCQPRASANIVIDHNDPAHPKWKY